MKLLHAYLNWLKKNLKRSTTINVYLLLKMIWRKHGPLLKKYRFQKIKWKFVPKTVSCDWAWDFQKKTMAEKF